MVVLFLSVYGKSQEKVTYLPPNTNWVVVEFLGNIFKVED